MKSRNFIVVAALAIVMMAVAACSGGPSAKEAYEVFTLAMDKIAGTGNWTAKEHSMNNGVLVVSGVTVKMPPMGFTLGENGESAKPAEGLPLEIASVELKNPLSKADLEKILAVADWRDQKEARLADNLTLKGLSLKGLTFGLSVNELGADEISFASMSLGAAGADAPAGRAGFLKALRLGRLDYKNFKTSSVAEMPDNMGRAQTSSTIGQVGMEGVAFDGEPLAGLEAVDPSGLFTIMTAMSAKSAMFRDIAMTLSDEKEMKGALTIAKVDEKDIKPLGAIGVFAMEGFKFDMTGLEKNMSLFMGLDKVTMNGLDLSGYVKKFVPFFVASAKDPDAAAEALMSAQTLGDFFVSPFSVDDVEMSGFEFKIADLFGFKIAKAGMTGALRTGEIPKNHKTSITGMEVFLPSSDPGDLEGFREMYEFAKNFGMNRFEIDIESGQTYDPATGIWQNRPSRMTVKDLFEMTGGLEVGGLTAERVEKLKSTPLNSMMFVMMAPEAVLGNLSFNSLDIKLEDRGLINRAFRFAAVMETGTTDVDAAAVDTLRSQVLSVIDLAVTLGGGQYLENPGELAKSLSAFLKEPGSLEIRLAAEPPLSYAVVESTAGDVNKLLNSLNISVSANGEAAPVLRFAIPTYSPSRSTAPDPWADEDEDEDGVME